MRRQQHLAPLNGAPRAHTIPVRSVPDTPGDLPWCSASRYDQASGALSGERGVGGGKGACGGRRGTRGRSWKCGGFYNYSTIQLYRVALYSTVLHLHYCTVPVPVPVLYSTVYCTYCTVIKSWWIREFLESSAPSSPSPRRRYTVIQHG